MIKGKRGWLGEAGGKEFLGLAVLLKRGAGDKITGAREL
jgi:hypothetical protein